MPNIQNLMPGRAGRQMHAQKVATILEFGYKVHLITSRVVMRLLNTSQSNSATLLKRMEEQDLLRQVNIKYSISAPRGNAYLLTPRGAAIAVRDLPGPLHQYDHRPESIRLDQSEHDLQLAEFAAAWVGRGAKLMQTDFMLRQVVRDRREKKIPDLVMQVGGGAIAVEYERQAKGQRDIDQMMMSSIKAGNMRTIWFFSVQSSFDQFTAAVDRQKIGAWKLNASNKWVAAGELWLPFSWRANQLAVKAEPADAVADDPAIWVTRFDDLEVAVESRSFDFWNAQGWSWGQLVATAYGAGFPLRIQSADHDMRLAVSYVTDDSHWYVHEVRERPEAGYDLGEARTAPSVMGVLPELGRVERAIRRAMAENFEF